MTPDPPPEDPSRTELGKAEASRLMADLRDRAGSGDGPAPVPAGDTAPVALSPSTHVTLAAARHHLDAAWHSSDAGTEIPDEARLRQVKRAVMAGMRPVTSHQVPFNRELSVAVDRLTSVVEDLVTQVSRADERLASTVRRVQAGIASVEVGGAELDDEVAALVERLADVATRLETAEAALAEQRQRLARVERSDATPAAPAPVAVVSADAAGGADQALLRRLARAARPAADDLRAWAGAVADVVVDATAEAPLLDLASDRGEWLAAWIDLGIEAIGVDDDPAALELLAAAGRPAVAADPAAHLASQPTGSLGAVTAATLADVVPLPSLVDVLDAAATALQPGGVLVLLVADPTVLAQGDPLWDDPRRRPLPARTLQHLLLDRGWAEIDLLPVGDEGATGPRATVVVARTPGGTPSG